MKQRFSTKKRFHKNLAQSQSEKKLEGFETKSDNAEIDNIKQIAVKLLAN